MALRIFGGDIGSSSETDAASAGDRVGDGAHWWHDRCFADAANPIRVVRVWYFDDDRVNERQVRCDRNAVVEEACVIELAVVVVDVFLVQCPADALGGAALVLAFNVRGVDRATGILNDGVAFDIDLAGFCINLDIDQDACRDLGLRPAR